MHSSLKRPFGSWSEYEEALSRLELNLDRGDGFEALAKFYFEYHRQTYLLETSHFPRIDGGPFPDSWVQELGLGNRDLGIDGIYKRVDDELVAVQVKFRSSQERLTFSDLATFWSESENAKFRMVFTNVVEITDVATRRRGHLIVTREQLDTLDEEFWAGFFAFSMGQEVPPKLKKSPRPYQDRALTNVVDGFVRADRGKLIAACGIGKTLIGLWAMERMNARNVLFMAPNLQLIRQTLREWSSQASESFIYLAVCSDQTITSDLDELSDALAGTDITVTTDPVEVANFLKLKSKSRKVIFSTYQSLGVISQAMQLIETKPFDLALFDEAHKTAGLDSESGFGLGLQDQSIAILKRLFLTATEKLYSPRLQAAAAENSRVVFSMDNKEIYGETFHRLSFSQAISEGIISDYRVVVAVMAGAELRSILNSHDLLLDTDQDDSQRAMRTNLVVNQSILKKVLVDTGARKLVSYHRSVRDAKNFAQEINSDEYLETIGAVGFSVDGSMSSSKRSQVIRAFEESETAVLTNARCLVEGVDIPIIDGVFFASPKNSLIDIVQAVGRALRKPYGVENGKIAAVVVPILLDPDSENVDVASSNFDRLYNVIQALRDQDEGIAEQVDQLNLQIATTGSSSRRSLGRILKLIVPAGVSIAEIESALELRIAEVNGSQSGSVIPTSHLGTGQRQSGRDRKLRTIGDYTPSKYKESLVDPTLEKFIDTEAILARSILKINNNNVGHCEKLGVISNNGQNGFGLTALGKSYLKQEILFENLFKNQLLLYKDDTSVNVDIYPYRIFIEFMLQVKTLSYLEFLYGIYPTDVSVGMTEAVNQAVIRVEAIRKLSIVPEIANEKSKNQILDNLEAATGLAMDFNDVWTDRTTTYNQYRYFRRHLELFEDVFIDQMNVFQFKEDGQAKAREILDRSAAYLEKRQYGDSYWVNK
jgi:superfamily II DNA or RNA helicase